MKIGNKEFSTTGHTYVMGILNVTPDSFSDGGKWLDRDNCIRHVETMMAEGADIIDVGGQSTRPGYKEVGVEEEIERVAPIIEAIKARFEVPLSLDTYRAEVAGAGIVAGADLINDIWGLKADSQMAKVIAKTQVACCLMHNRKEAVYEDFMQEVAADLAHTIHMAQTAGIADDRIILDPGVGFGKTLEQNLEVIDCLEELHVLGYPLLLGCSRKSFIGQILDVPVEERLEGTLVTTALAVMKGCMFVRVHDVKENARTIAMTEKLIGRR